MNYQKLKKLYISSPKCLKSMYSVIPWPLRMGSEYRKMYNFLNDSKHWSKKEWNLYQTKELRKLLAYCNENIPYYRNLFKENKINVYHHDIWQEFYKIPFMTKEILREHNDELTPKKNNNLFSLTTGGTTGKPVTIYYDKASYKKEWAFKMFFWNYAIGYNFSAKKATFRGVDFNGKLFYENPIYNEIRFSPFKLDGKYLEKILEKLKSYKPDYLHGYPSALEQLAKYMNKYNEKLSGIKGIILISENIFDYQIKLLEKTFNSKVYSFYGLSERVILASMDNDCDIFFSHPAYGITELVDKDECLITNENIMGELVGTGFINKGMPLLRYKTADFSSWIIPDNKALQMPALQYIKGRWNQEYLIGKNLSKISLTSLNMHSKVYNNINKLQFYQDTIGDVQLNIIKDEYYTKEDENDIRRELGDKLGCDFTLFFNYVNHLELTQSGKSKYLVQKITV